MFSVVPCVSASPYSAPACAISAVSPCISATRLCMAATASAPPASSPAAISGVICTPASAAICVIASRFFEIRFPTFVVAVSMSTLPETMPFASLSGILTPAFFAMFMTLTSPDSTAKPAFAILSDAEPEKSIEPPHSCAICASSSLPPLWSSVVTMCCTALAACGPISRMAL